MQCPFCQTENREDRETCYVCAKDISTIRLLANKARQHYNDALEHAERDRVPEAIGELKNALDLDSSLINAHVVLGTLYARQGNFAEARACWKQALQQQPELARAHDYLERVESVQAALPTIKTYRRVALLLLTSLVAVAAFLIIKLRPEAGTTELQMANQLITAGKPGEARPYVDKARILSAPGNPVNISADTLAHTIHFDTQQRIRFIQDMKYRQLYPEALAAMVELQQTGLDDSTSASLQTIRDDISYYYRSMLGQLYSAYERGDVNFETLQGEISRFISLYPPSPERDEVQGYLDHAETMETQIAMDELKRRFSLDNNLEVAVEGLGDLAQRFGNSLNFEAARTEFEAEMLSTQISLFTGYLDQSDFVRATEILVSIDNVSLSHASSPNVNPADYLTADISNVIEHAWSLLRDAQREYLFRQVEQFIQAQDMNLATDALWEALQEPNLSSAEKGLLRSYWRKINQSNRLKRLLSSPAEVRRFFNLNINNRQASSTLQLYRGQTDATLARPQQLLLTGLAAASAIKLNLNDEATSLARALRQLDARSTVTVRIRELIRQRQTREINSGATNDINTTPTSAESETTSTSDRKDTIE